MNQKLLLQLHQDLQKQPDPFCSLEEVAELYHLTCLIDESIPDFEVSDDATPLDIENLLSTYLKDRYIYRGKSISEVTLCPNDDFGYADLESLEHVDDQIVFDLLVALVSIYSYQAMNTVYFTEHIRDWREDELGEDGEDEEDEFGQILLESANEILATKTALAIQKHALTPLADQIGSLRIELLHRKNEIPAFLETYISDALDTVERCNSDRFEKMIGKDYYNNNNPGPLYFNVFFLYPDSDHSHQNLIDNIDECINNELQELSGEIEIKQENYKDISFFVETVNEFKEVVNNFNQIIGSL